MAFKVFRFSGAPDYETLQAAKLTNFPLEERDYKPFSQARICLSATGLHVQFHCFEAESLPSSCVRAVLRPAPERLLELSLFAGGQYEVKMDGAPLPGASLQPFTGEDLQGVYWGGTFTILPDHLTGCLPQTGDVFRGNFYKLCEDPAKPHYGSFFTANFEKPLDVQENLGEFLVIDF